MQTKVGTSISTEAQINRYFTLTTYQFSIMPVETRGIASLQ
ncbi:MAG: hypothetical protein VSS75_030060 [Candidatus Parabeggiatoa sp.]|nr:hypothetical protein [Candidatus Parabeggiatoa sp.]